MYFVGGTGAVAEPRFSDTENGRGSKEDPPRMEARKQPSRTEADSGVFSWISGPNHPAVYSKARTASEGKLCGCYLILYRI